MAVGIQEELRFGGVRHGNRSYQNGPFIGSLCVNESSGRYGFEFGSKIDRNRSNLLCMQHQKAPHYDLDGFRLKKEGRIFVQIRLTDTTTSRAVLEVDA